MVRVAIMLLVVLGLSLSVAPRADAGDAESIQALEAQITEAERAGISGLEINFLRMMLKDLKKEAAESPSAGADARRMRPNYFDAQNVAWLGDCGQYDDRQAFAFCASARNAFQNYIQAFNAGAEDHQLDVFYAAHEKSANDLILYLGDKRSSTTSASTKQEDTGQEPAREPSEAAKAIQIDEPASEPFERIDTGADGGSMTTTSKGRVYEPQPETRTGEKAWFSDRDYAIANARLEAANDIDEACREKGARSDRPNYRDIAGGASPPPRWSYAVPDCVQGGWDDEEWKCRATVSGHCYWE